MLDCVPNGLLVLFCLSTTSFLKYHPFGTGLVIFSHRIQDYAVYMGQHLKSFIKYSNVQRTANVII
jgi:cytochrome b involved in lipid metabolism